jgi:hypothetical protein
VSEEPARPGPDVLADYLEGLLGPEESREVERWVTEDEATAEQLRELEELPSLLAADPAEPMPGGVASRIDAALAAAAAERASEAPVAAPVPLRRRRWLVPALVAAATVGALGIGGQVLSEMNGGAPDSADSAAGSSASEDAGGTEQAAPDAQRNPPATPEPTRLTRDNFADDVSSRLLAEPTAARWRIVRGQTDSEAPATDAARYPILSDRCGAQLGTGPYLPISLDGEPALLVLRRVPGEPGKREAVAYPARCPAPGLQDTGAPVAPLASAVIPRP